MSICGHDLIECVIRHVDLAENPTYDALSYTWGNPKAVKGDSADDYAVTNRWPIIANGRLLYVTKSLHEALVALNSEARTAREEADGADETFPPYNKTELIRAAEEGRLADVQSAIHRGAKLTSQDVFGETALHYAAENGHLDIVKMLLQHGADRERIDSSGRTPLACCLQRQRRQHEQVAIVLRDSTSVTLGPTEYSTVRDLWIDAHCINQEDIDERNAQVSMMARIYSSARSSIVWLGPEDNSTRIARDAVSRLNAASFQACREAAWQFTNKSHDHRHDGHQHDTEDVGGISVPQFQAVLDLIRRSWFERTWVLQEVVLAKDVEILCGSQRFTWMELFELVQHRLGGDEDVHIMGLPQHPNSNRHKGAKGMGAWVTTDLRRRLRLDTPERQHVRQIEELKGRVDHSWDEKLSLCAVLVLTWNFEVTDPKDKVFALLSIAAPLDSGDEIVVDYRRSTKDVFTELGRIFVVARGNNKIQSFHSGDVEEFEPREGLSFVQAPLCENSYCNVLPSHNKNQRPTGLPSWVPAFNKPLTTERLWRTSFTAASARELKIHPSAPSVLKLDGYEFDKIVEIEDKPHEREIGDGISYDIFSWLKLVQLGERGASEFSQMEVLWRTLMFDHLWAGGLEGAKQSFRRFISENLRMGNGQSEQDKARVSLYSELQAADTSQSLPSLQEIEEFRAEDVGHNCRPDAVSEVSSFHSAFYRHYRARCLFRTEAGRFGLGPRIARVGDTVWLLSGARTPFILRPAHGLHGDRQVSLIGEAYVHGAMDGKLSQERGAIFKPVQIV
ncbi:hypothetical protein N8I77_002784 [Diaporthe amygdali]|uniref:Heterokaryon incompatibility domain-containing protein n=1 Tax=Phomopsis amygdali TaxID=1214568 RepID=A0AAD9STF2_PHOAM|nr:hypothetical protein N8I77_002784 [Diaporthe amygdali]